MINNKDSCDDLLGLTLLDVSNLPIAKYRSLIIDTVREHQVTVIFGDTGSGKTTQIPKYLFEAKINDGSVIAVTQPRRIAAISMAKRVAEEMKCGLGIEVGYEVRYDARFGASTKIKYMTDGMLLNECLADHTLSEYSVIMIDEAHERSIHTDVLMGLLKKIARRRIDLKIIIASATIKTQKFSAYFNNAPIVSFEGRLFPVEVQYSRDDCHYMEESVKIVKDIHASTTEGDILVFLTGQDEIDECCENLAGIAHLIVLPLYGSMDCDTQQRVFQRLAPGQRKVVVATNIAETTITINGIKFVIDCGFVKQNDFNVYLGMEVLLLARISKAQADQRKGRAGRTCNGKCFRLYDEFEYNRMNDEAVPEIQRMNLCEIYLKIAANGLSPMEFDFIDAPDRDTLVRAEEELLELDLIDAQKSLTEIGKEMSDLPVEPILGKVLMSSSVESCTVDIVTILSMMTDSNVFKRTRDRNREAEVRMTFHHPYGDHIMSLNMFNEFLKKNKSKQWCHQHNLNYDKLMMIDQARDQLLKLLARKKVPLDSLPERSHKNPIRNAIIRGFYRNICYKAQKGKYIRYLDNQDLYIHPSSCLSKEKPQIILYHEVVKTSKPFMHGIMKLEESILENFPLEMKKIHYRPTQVNQPMNFMEALNR